MQVHFGAGDHIGSEHTVNGTAFPAEVRTVTGRDKLDEWSRTPMTLVLLDRKKCDKSFWKSLEINNVVYKTCERPSVPENQNSVANWILQRNNDSTMIQS